MGLHQCHCDDGVTVPCICVRGRDHIEAEFDLPYVPNEDQPKLNFAKAVEEDRPAEGKGITTTEDAQPKRKGGNRRKGD